MNDSAIFQKVSFIHKHKFPIWILSSKIAWISLENLRIIFFSNGLLITINSLVLRKGKQGGYKIRLKTNIIKLSFQLLSVRSTTLQNLPTMTWGYLEDYLFLMCCVLSDLLQISRYTNIPGFSQECSQGTNTHTEWIKTRHRFVNRHFFLISQVR